MSLNQKETQSNQPLGGGDKVEKSKTNRVLYGLLAVLISVFVWKMSSENSVTMDIIPKQKNTQANLGDDYNLSPNIDVQIAEATRPKVNSAKILKHNKNAEDSFIAKITEKKFLNDKKLKQKKESLVVTAQDNSTSLASIIENDDYSYIYTSEVELAEGSYQGLDKNGFVITNETSSQNVEILTDEQTDRAIVNLGLQQTNYTQDESNASFVDVTTNDEEETIAYPSTGIPYGTAAYPLKDTLPWHPYESLAYIKEEKEVFVAKKVRRFPTADDLEPFINPRTLGDRDTRMGYGVVIRPHVK